MYGFTLILTLGVVGGVIAYIGDQVGMNIGRKKLTIFGLRPKHTSVLITIATGIIIVSASLAVLAIASQDVRTALFRMKEIQSELMEAEAEVLLQKVIMEENEETITGMEVHLNRLLEEAGVLQAEVVELEIKTEELRQDYLLVSTAFGQIREANIAFNASEVILTTVLRKGLSREEIKASLEEFMLEVDEVAYERSARVQEPRGYRAIFLQTGVLELAVEHIFLAPDDVIVRAISESNTIPGVPVVVYLENFLDQMVFSKGTVLAGGIWDSRTSLELDQVILQILKDANSTALDAGMALSEDRGISVSLPGRDFLDALSTSRNLSGPVQVRLVVARDTWRSVPPVPVYLELVP